VPRADEAGPSPERNPGDQEPEKGLAVCAPRYSSRVETAAAHSWLI
jgi:hypothetical protein